MVVRAVMRGWLTVGSKVFLRKTRKEVESKMPKGIKGFQKGHIPRTAFKKGYKMSGEMKKKISEALKGRSSGMLGKHHTAETKKKMSKNNARYWLGKKKPEMSGENHPMYGKHHTKESRQKMSESCKKNPARYWLGKRPPDHVYEAVRLAHLGKPPRNKGKGTRTILRKRIKNLQKYKKWRMSVFERDKYTCQECGKRGGELNPHHIIPFSLILNRFGIKTLKQAEKCALLWDVNNGMTLCRECHKLTDTWGVNAKDLAYDWLDILLNINVERCHGKKKDTKKKV